MASAKHDLHVKILAELRKDSAKENFDMEKFTKRALDLDDDIVVGTVGQVWQAARIYGDIPEDTPSPWSIMKSVDKGGDTPDYSDFTVKDLKAAARDKGVVGVHTMRKDDLIKALS